MAKRLTRKEAKALVRGTQTPAEVFPSVALVERIAAEFARILREWLTAEEWAEMRKRNRYETDPNVCHSHDFCDANEAMDEAFRKARGKGADVGDGADAELWGAAWNKAMAEHLTEARK